MRLIASGFDVPDAKLAVTLVTDEAFRRYQSSIRVFEPVNDPVGPLVQVPPAESVTVLIGPVLAAWTAIAATSASPVVVAGMLTVSDRRSLKSSPSPGAEARSFRRLRRLR